MDVNSRIRILRNRVLPPTEEKDDFRYPEFRISGFPKIRNSGMQVSDFRTSGKPDFRIFPNRFSDFRRGPQKHWQNTAGCQPPAEKNDFRYWKFRISGLPKVRNSGIQISGFLDFWKTTCADISESFFFSRRGPQKQ